MASFLDTIIRTRKAKNSASVAKSRLQDAIGGDRAMRNMPEFLPSMQQDMLEVVNRYFAITSDEFKWNFDRLNNGGQMLNINIPLPIRNRHQRSAVR